MRKMLNFAFGYAVAAMAGGVFFREFTKFQEFEGKTTLSFVHTHLFLLGMIVFLVTALYIDRIKENKKFKSFLIIYNIGVPITAVMLLVRGVLQVLGINVSKGMDGAISGIAGIGHILTGIGIVLLILSMKESAKE